MINSLRKVALIPEISLQTLVSAGILASFLWLLMHNRIDPIVVYLLQLYLAS